MGAMMATRLPRTQGHNGYKCHDVTMMTTTTLGNNSIKKLLAVEVSALMS